MSSGAGEDDDAETTELGALRARLYAPDSTPADRAAYDAALAEGSTDRLRRRGLPPSASNQRSPAEQIAPAASPAPVPQRRRIPALTGGLLAVAILVLGAVLGAGISSVTRSSVAPASPSATPRSPSVTTALPLPTPVAARSLPMAAATRKATIAVLAKTLATSTDDTAVNRAIQVIGSNLSSAETNGAWMARYACSNSTGIVRASTQGRPVVLSPTDGAIDLPAHAHFRITIYLTRSAGWSWVLSAPRGTTTTAPIAIGAGSPEAGAVQYAEFDASGTGNLSRIEVSSTGGTPFLWQLDSCISGG